VSKNEIAKAEAPALPSMYTREDDDIDSSALSIRKVYLMQDRSSLVRAKVASPGDVVAAHDSDDEGADFLIGGDEGRTSYIGFVLDRQRVVARIDGSDFEYLPNDYQRAADERDVWVGYNYLISVPEVDEYLPMKQLFIKTSGTKVYQKINTYIQVQRGLGLTDPVAVEFTVKELIGKASGQPYFALVPKHLTGDAIPKGQLEIAKRLQDAGAHLERFGASQDLAPVETAEM
jgi:hypothetical protein